MPWPSKVFWYFLLISAILYVLANQTQIGWIYIMSNLILGFLGALFIYQFGLLHKIKTSRRYKKVAKENAQPDLLSQQTDFQEDDPIRLELHLRPGHLRPIFMLQGEESCPFLPPVDQKQGFFVPWFSAAISLQYDSQCYQRGFYTFPPLKLTSRGPFGFFKQSYQIAQPDTLLIYPNYLPLKRFRLFEHYLQTAQQSQKAGLGDQVLGLRDYRHGDPIKNIHWRSTARQGNLIVKEMSTEEEIQFNLVLDFWGEAGVRPDKYSPFECAIRVASSLGYYATQRNLPFVLHGQGRVSTPPKQALSWGGLWTFLAKAKNDGGLPLASVLDRLKGLSLAIILVTDETDPALYQALESLGQRGTRLFVLFINAQAQVPAAALSLNQSRISCAAVGTRNWAETLERI